MEFEFKSKLGPYIEGRLFEKERSGYFVNEPELRIYRRLDNFIIQNNFDNGKLSRELVEAWSIQKETESRNTRNKRISLIRKLAEYMISLGIDAYYPHQSGSSEYPITYIPTRDELVILFSHIDSLPTTSHLLYFKHVGKAIPVIFRLYYCLGLRRQEALNLRRNEVNLIDGYLYIKQSKGDKSRKVYLREDMVNLLKSYDTYIDQEISSHRECFFIGRDRTTPFSESFVSTTFRELWQDSFPDWKGKRPSVHSLRHAFIIERISRWMSQGNDVHYFLPYLSRFVGHHSIADTMYYYKLHDVQTGAFSTYIENEKSTISEETLKWLDQ